MLDIVPLEPWHIEVLHSEGRIDGTVYNSQYANYLCKAGPAVAVLLNGRIAGAGGILELWGSVAEGWSLITDFLREHPIALVKAFKAFFNTCPKYKRLQITVEEDFETAQVFAEYLGFTPEGRMEYYSPTGKTHILYSRIQ